MMQRQEERRKMTKDYYTTQDIMDVTHASRDTVYLWRDYGLMKMSRLSRSYGCSAAELKRFLAWAEGKELVNEEQIHYYAKKMMQSQLQQ